MSIEGKSISELLVERLLDLPEWMEGGACLDEEVQPLDESDKAKMLDLCQDCAVVDQCRGRILEIHEDRDHRDIKSGVFGGESFFPRKEV